MRALPTDRPVLHVLTDGRLSRGRSHLEVGRAALEGGADVLQLRDKTLQPGELQVVARELREAAERAGAVFVVNDHLDVALAVHADGLHLGQEDLPIAEARRRWPRPRLLGASARTPERAREVVAAGADYLGTGPVFATATKAAAPAPIGLKGLERVVAGVADLGVPVFGIGGIGPENAADVVAAGAAGVAIVSSVVGAPDVRVATRAIRDALDRL